MNTITKKELEKAGSIQKNNLNGLVCVVCHEVIKEVFWSETRKIPTDSKKCQKNVDSIEFYIDINN